MARADPLGESHPKVSVSNTDPAAKAACQNLFGRGNGEVVVEAGERRAALVDAAGGQCGGILVGIQQPRCRNRRAF